jgi:hypothetical protein
MTTYGEVDVYNHVFLISALVGGEWPLYPRYPLDRRLGGPHSRSGPSGRREEEKILYKYYIFGHPSSCLYLQTILFFFSKHNVSETGFCLRLQIKPTQSIELVPIFGQLCQLQDGVHKSNTTQTICES